MQILPFAEFPFFTEEVVLDGATYRFAFLWNSRTASWTLSLYDVDGVEIVMGVPVALDQNLLGQYRHLEIPPGELWAVDASGTLAAIGRDDLADGRVYLAYATEAEIP